MATPQPWWKNAVIYQIYPRSFQDSNGDGIGDLAGITKRLDYLETLGIDAIWLSPVYRSPQDDNGYDISDYCDIDPLFGTLEDMEVLIGEAKKHHIRIIMDLVLNHSSDEHRWFQEAKKSRDNPYHDYYVWRDGVEGTPPNDMKATFGGSAWTWVPEVGQYYFHQFSVKQPDLNWDNPALRQELYKTIRFWMDKGVGGFRLDVIDQIAKDPDLKITSNGPMLHAYLRELNANTFGGTDLVTVGEAWGATVQNAPIYSDPRGKEFSMVFQFEHIGLDQIPGKAKWDLAPLQLSALKEVLTKWQVGLHGKGWNSLFWNNHDLPRIVSRWGNDGVYRVPSAKMLATMLHGLEGTPYIFQGEELGMTNIRLKIEEYVDLEIHNLYAERTAKGYSREDVMESIYARGRDNARTPMQWDDSPNAGFTTGKPWLPVNPNYREINASAALSDPDSVFYHYQKLIRLRKETPVISHGSFTLLDEDNEEVFAYLREDENTMLLVVCNFTDRELGYEIPAEFRTARCLISNYPDAGPTLRPYEAYMLLAGK